MGQLGQGDTLVLQDEPLRCLASAGDGSRDRSGQRAYRPDLCRWWLLRWQAGSDADRLLRGDAVEEDRPPGEAGPYDGRGHDHRAYAPSDEDLVANGDRQKWPDTGPALQADGQWRRLFEHRRLQHLSRRRHAQHSLPGSQRQIRGVSHLHQQRILRGAAGTYEHADLLCPRFATRTDRGRSGHRFDRDPAP